MIAYENTLEVQISCLVEDGKALEARPDDLLGTADLSEDDLRELIDAPRKSLDKMAGGREKLRVPSFHDHADLIFVVIYDPFLAGANPWTAKAEWIGATNLITIRVPAPRAEDTAREPIDEGTAVQYIDASYCNDKARAVEITLLDDPDIFYNHYHLHIKATAEKEKQMVRDRVYQAIKNPVTFTRVLNWAQQRIYRFGKAACARQPAENIRCTFSVPMTKGPEANPLKFTYVVRDKYLRPEEDERLNSVTPAATTDSTITPLYAFSVCGKGGGHYITSATGDITATLDTLWVTNYLDK